MKTFASVFSGGELVGCGAVAAGYTHIWGIEYDDKIAEVARMNGFNVTTANILDYDGGNIGSKTNGFMKNTKTGERLNRPDLFHASPLCPNFSVAKQGGEETALDIALAEKVAEFIAVLRPPTLTIENVQAYIKSASYKIIMRAIENAGYMYDAQILNAADFGVPQSRRRLFVRAVLGGMVPYLPAPVKHVGWYAAIEDILHTLPESKFADWQLAQLPDFCDGALFTPNKRDDDLMFAGAEGPALTITSNRNQGNIKAFLMAGGGNTNFDEAYPGRGVRYADQPSMGVTTVSDAGGSMPRAFIVDGGNASKLGNIYHFDNRPMTTVTADGQPRAFLVDGKPLNFGGDLNIIDAPTPTPTLTASQDKHPFRAWLSLGRVVSMTPRALARFQSMPDSYVLPERRTLAGRIIGNGVPSLMYQRIAEQFTYPNNPKEQ